MPHHANSLDLYAAPTSPPFHLLAKERVSVFPFTPLKPQTTYVPGSSRERTGSLVVEACFFFIVWVCPPSVRVDERAVALITLLFVGFVSRLGRGVDGPRVLSLRRGEKHTKREKKWWMEYRVVRLALPRAGVAFRSARLDLLTWELVAFGSMNVGARNRFQAIFFGFFVPWAGRLPGVWEIRLGGRRWLDVTRRLNSVMHRRNMF